MRALCLLVFLFAATLPHHAADGHSTNTVNEADLKKFKFAPGLKAELFAAEPLLVNPVAFSIDGRGHFYIAESHRWATSVFDITANTPWLLDDLSFRTVNDRAAFLARTFATNFAVLTNDSELIRLVEDRDGDGRAETSSVFADGFRESTSGTAAGVLAQGTNVWFTSVPDLWRFSETVNSRSVISNRSRTVAGRRLNTDSLITDLLATGLGVHISVSGHDVHGLIRGHDGRIYFSFGDRGVCVTNREGVVLNVPDTGGVLRCEPDGRNLEIFCTGLRNPQELAFDDLGNLWTVDNDTAGADPCRVLHLVEGGDYGWRMSYQHMKGFGPWVSEEMWRGGLDGILPPAGTVSQGPAGLAFYPGTGLTPQLAGKFVHADFPGGVWAYSVKPRGASYELADKEKILWNCWPTDVDFGPDGALYVLDWVESWTRSGKGRIYRVTANDQVPMTKAQLEMVRETQRLLGEGMANRGEKELLGLLGHADRRVRLEAQWELASRGTNSLGSLSATAFNSKNLFARLHALWGIGQIARRVQIGIQGGDLSDELFAMIPLVSDGDQIVAGQAARVIADAQLFQVDVMLAEILSNAPPALRFQAAMAYGTIMHKGQRGSYSSKQKAAQWLADKIPQARRFADKLVQPGLTFHPGWPETSGYLVENAGGDLFLQHAGVRHWRRLEALEADWSSYRGLSWALANRATNSNVAVRRAAILALGLWTNSFVTNLLVDSNPMVVLQAARTINASPVDDAFPALASLVNDPRFRDANWGWSALSNITPAGPFSANVRPPRDQVLLRSLNANFRLGEPKNAEALVRFAASSRRGNEADATEVTTNPPPHVGGYSHLRAEALFLLGAWEVLPAKTGDLSIKPTKDPNHGSVPTVNPENWPGWFDRVVGLYRPLPPRPADAARRALAPHITALLADKEPEIAKAALDAAVKLRLTNASPALLALMRSASTTVSLRKLIPGALSALNAVELSDAVKLALADSDAAIRAAALPHLGRLQSDDAVRILSGIVSANGDTRLAQAAFAALGKLDAPGADAVLRSSLTNLLAGKLPAALELDLMEAAARRSDPEIKLLVAQREAARSKDDVLGGWRSALVGGDAERGRTIFAEKVEVQCLRCHAVKGQGGIVGPKLDGIGTQRSREYLLESMVFPNRAIASGFESVTLTLKSGAEHAGLVKGEDDKELRLESPEEGALRIAKADIVTRQRGLSAMPEGMEQFLSRREVRDLVEYLAGLK
jgi:quinoprotein glucose dehydrogenase